MSIAIEAAPHIEFEFYHPRLADSRTAWELAHIELATRNILTELYGLVPPADSPSWITDVLDEQTEQVHEDVAQVIAETNAALQEKERGMIGVVEANKQLHYYFQGEIDTFYHGRGRLDETVRRTQYFDQSSERSMAEATSAHEAIRQAYGQIKKGIFEQRYKGADMPEPISLVLFDNADDGDLQGGRQGADVLRALGWLDQGFEKDDVLKLLKNSFTTQDGVSTSIVHFHPHNYDHGPTGGYDLDYDVTYILGYQRTPDGTQRVTLEIAPAQPRTQYT